MEIKRKIYILRPYKLEDAETIALNANNKKISDNLRDSFPHPYKLEDALFFIKESMRLKEIQYFAIIVDEKAVGGIGFTPQKDIEKLNAEIGYWLGEDYWGKGIISDAIKIISEYIFENTGIIRLFAVPFAHNIRSIKALEKAGFTKIATLKNAAVKHGKIFDMLHFELLKKIY